MPYYSFRNKDTNEEFSAFVHMSELDQYLLDNPNIEQMITAPNIAYRLDKKPEQGFRDLLKEIKKKHSQGFTKSTINTF